jgi:uncharacterized Fe-S cluster-containing protein
MTSLSLTINGIRYWAEVEFTSYDDGGIRTVDEITNIWIDSEEVDNVPVNAFGLFERELIDKVAEQ